MSVREASELGITSATGKVWVTESGERPPTPEQLFAADCITPDEYAQLCALQENHVHRKTPGSTTTLSEAKRDLDFWMRLARYRQRRSHPYSGATGATLAPIRRGHVGPRQRPGVRRSATSSRAGPDDDPGLGDEPPGHRRAVA